MFSHQAGLLRSLAWREPQPRVNKFGFAHIEEGIISASVLVIGENLKMRNCERLRVEYLRSKNRRLDCVRNLFKHFLSIARPAREIDYSVFYLDSVLYCFTNIFFTFWP
jgi:hypothetical protein